MASFWKFLTDWENMRTVRVYRITFGPMNDYFTPFWVRNISQALQSGLAPSTFGGRKRWVAGFSGVSEHCVPCNYNWAGEESATVFLRRNWLVPTERAGK